jgi:hypothetical protein
VVVHQQFRHRHQACRLHAIVALQPGQPAVAALGLAHAVRGAGPDQGRHAGVLFQLGGAGGRFFRVAEAALEQGLERFAQALVAVALTLALAVGGHPGRHLEGGAEGADQHIEQREQRHFQHHEEVQRQVDAVRRIEQHHIARIESCRHGDADGGGHQGH